MKLFALCKVVAATTILCGCTSSPPVPVTPDGSSRVPANSPGRIQALQDRTAADRALLSENNLLKGQVDVLQQRLNNMAGIVREALILPAAPPPAVEPAQGLERRPPTGQPLPNSPFGLSKLPKEAYSVNRNGVVIRVFHEFARTDFEPTAEVARALREATTNADSVVVSGRTDSEAVNPIDRLIAIERAMKARSWLINNGVSAAKITTRFNSAGQFIADNTTEEGRALNRRVEIDVRHLPSSDLGKG